MDSDAQDFSQHIAAVLALSQRLAALDIAIYQHNYHALAFGSWTIVAGKRKERIRFTWDGRDRFLTVEQAAFPDSQQRTEWQRMETEGANIRLP